MTTQPSFVLGKLPKARLLQQNCWKGLKDQQGVKDLDAGKQH